MARKSVISVGFLKWAISSNRKLIAFDLIRMKAEDGKVIHPKRYKKRHLADLHKLNLIGFCPYRQVYLQRNWEEIHRVLGITTLQFVTITHKVLFKYSFQDLAYSAGLQYMYRLQKDGGTQCGNPKRKKPRIPLHPSVHKGGIAHSLMAEFFGKSIHWSQGRRISCQSRGLILFKRRKAPCYKFKERDAIPDVQKDYLQYDITSACDIRVEFKFSIPRWVRKNYKKRVFNAKEGVYTYE